ncbi:hypothetical protein FBU59_002094, partial [Linderina macrospora]
MSNLTPSGQSLVGDMDRSAKQRLEVTRQGTKGRRGSSSMQTVASVSPQKGQHITRYSPSLAGWSTSYKESSVLSTIRDQDDADEIQGGSAPEHDTSKPDIGAHSDIPDAGSSGHKYLPGALPSASLSAHVKDPYSSPFGDESSRGYWQHPEMQSVRSHSSLGTGTSAHQQIIAGEKEEEVEDAPQPMEADVATFMVGGVSTGKRKRAVLSSIAGDKVPADLETSDIDEHESNQLVALVTMDGIINCYNPKLKTNHFLCLNSNDPVLGIWKIKMHEEVCNPSPLETMARIANVDFDLEIGDELLASTPAKRIYRRVGLSRRDLYHAVCHSIYVEDRLFAVDQAEARRRRRIKRRLNSSRSQLMANTSTLGKAQDGLLRTQKQVQRHKQAQDSTLGTRKAARYNRVGRAMRSIGHHLRDLATGTAAHNADSPMMGPIPVQDMNSAFLQLVTSGLPKPVSTELTAALTGWYGENRNDYRRGLRVADSLVVSTWRGTTYFVDTGTLLDVAHYLQLFMHRWNRSRDAAITASAGAAAGSGSDNEGTHSDSQSCLMASLYGHLSQFTDINGLISRLRANASVIQFKFQDTVAAFVADTYAPATGGPNVPCLFYVDYKDRIWVYYHLDEIAEMDDVYGATWFRDEILELQLPDEEGKEQQKSQRCNYDKPFSIVDLAYRRINLDPWMPLPGDDWYKKLVSSNDCQYPYSSKTWRKVNSANKKQDTQHA